MIGEGAKEATIAHITFYGDATDLSPSVPKVIDSFSKYSQFKSQVYSVANREDQIKPKTDYIFFYENRIKNRFFNKILGLDVYTYMSLVNKLNKHRPDILHFHNRQSLIDYTVGKLKYKPNKIVVHYHRYFENPIFPKCANIYLGVSKAVADQLKYHAPQSDLEKILFLHNPIPEWVLTEKSHFKNNVLKPIQDWNFLYLGGLEKHKGFQAIELLMKYRNVKVLICGSKAHKKDNFLGFLANHELKELFPKIDGIIFPSKIESFGLVALEAMQLNKILIASNTPGLNEITEQLTLTFDYKNDQELLKSIDLLEKIISSNQVNSIIKEQQEKLKQFNPNIIAKKLDGIYFALDSTFKSTD